MISRTMIAAAVAAVLGLPTTAGAAETFREAITETKPLIDWRLRYEGVDQSEFSEQADALTSRLRLGFETGRLAGTSLLAEGVWHGEVRDVPQGQNGFGYDPHFWLPELACTVAELSDHEKNDRSHRGQAMRALLQALRSIEVTP